MKKLYDRCIFSRQNNASDGRREKKFFSDGKHFESNYYATAFWMPPNDQEGKIREFVVEGAKRKEISAEDNIEVFAAVVDKLMGIFTSLRIPAQFLNQDEMLTYLHSCVSDNPRQMKMPKHNLLLDNFQFLECSTD